MLDVEHGRDGAGDGNKRLHGLRAEYPAHLPHSFVVYFLTGNRPIPRTQVVLYLISRRAPATSFEQDVWFILPSPSLASTAGSFST